MDQNLRVGNFTSSEIIALTKSGKGKLGFGEKAITYIMETNMERMLGRPIDGEINSKPTSWGNLLEPIVFECLPTDYTFSSQLTDKHPTIDYWVGSKDGTREGVNRAVIDLKSPFTLKSFVQLVLPIYLGFEGIEAMNMVRNGFTHNGFDYPKHIDGDKYYWQLVSNAIINNCDWAELVIFAPYKSQLSEIYQLAHDNTEVKWLAYSDEAELPLLVDGGLFKSVNIIRFEIPQADKDLLTELVNKAGTLLICRPENPVIIQAELPPIEDNHTYAKHPGLRESASIEQIP